MTTPAISGSAPATGSDDNAAENALIQLKFHIETGADINDLMINDNGEIIFNDSGQLLEE